MHGPGKLAALLGVITGLLFLFVVPADAKKPIPAGAVGLAQDVKAQAVAHDWKALLGRCEPGHRKTQKDIGMGDAQYIAEILGLHSAGNNIKRGKTVTFKDLGRIRTIKLETFAWSGAWVVVTGKVTLAGGKTLSLTMMIAETERGFYLSGAVG